MCPKYPLKGLGFRVKAIKGYMGNNGKGRSKRTYFGKGKSGNACIRMGQLLRLQGLGFRVQGGYMDYTLIFYGLSPGSQLESFKLRG